MDIKKHIPFPEYPDVTEEDIRSLHGRNMKPLTDREKARLIHMFRTENIAEVTDHE